MINYIPKRSIFESFSRFPFFPKSIINKAIERERKEWKKMIELAKTKDLKEKSWYRLLTINRSEPSINLALKNKPTNNLEELVKDKYKNFTVIQTIQGLSVLSTDIIEYKKSFILLWEKVIELFKDSNQPYLDSAIHFILMDAISNIKPLFTSNPNLVHDVYFLLLRMYPLVINYLGKCSVDKQIKCCTIYKEFNLCTTEMLSVLVNTLNTMTNLPDIDLSLLENVCEQPSLSLNTSVKNLFIERILDDNRIRSLSSEQLIKELNDFNYPKLFEGKEVTNNKVNSKVVNLLIRTLLERKVMESKYLIDFLNALIKQEQYIDNKFLEDIYKRSSLEIGLLFDSNTQSIIKKDINHLFPYNRNLIPTALDLLKRNNGHRKSMLNYVLNLLKKLNFKNMLNETKELKLSHDAFFCAIKILLLTPKDNDMLYGELHKKCKRHIDTVWRSTCACLNNYIKSKTGVLVKEDYNMDYSKYHKAEGTLMKIDEDEIGREREREKFFLGTENIHTTKKEYNDIIKQANKIFTPQYLSDVLNKEHAFVIRYDIGKFNDLIEGFIILYNGICNVFKYPDIKLDLSLSNFFDSIFKNQELSTLEFIFKHSPEESKKFKTLIGSFKELPSQYKEQLKHLS